VTVAVLVLLAVFGSTAPAAGLTVARLAMVPVTLRATLATKLTVTVPPDGMVKVPVRLVSVLLNVTVALVLAVVATAVSVPSPVGRVSAKVALVAVLGPAFVMTSV